MLIYLVAELTTNGKDLHLLMRQKNVRRGGYIQNDKEQHQESPWNVEQELQTAQSRKGAWADILWCEAPFTIQSLHGVCSHFDTCLEV